MQIVCGSGAAWGKANNGFGWITVVPHKHGADLAYKEKKHGLNKIIIKWEKKTNLTYIMDRKYTNHNKWCCKLHDSHLLVCFIQ